MGVHRELRMVSVASHEVFIGANGNQHGLISFLTDSRAQVDSNERTRPPPATMLALKTRPCSHR